MNELIIPQLIFVEEIRKGYDDTAVRCFRRRVVLVARFALHCTDSDDFLCTNCNGFHVVHQAIEQASSFVFYNLWTDYPLLHSTARSFVRCVNLDVDRGSTKQRLGVWGCGG